MARKNIPIPPPTPQDIARFWSKVNVIEDELCWEWRASLAFYGYGQIRFGGPNGTTFRAHRIAYFLFYGTDPGGLCVCHHCDNPRCCNPHHMFIGTHTDNMTDMNNKGRRRGGETKDINRLITKAKVTLPEVKAIRIRYSQGEPRNVLAKEYGITGTSIDRIVKRLTWKHI